MMMLNASANLRPRSELCFGWLPATLVLQRMTGLVDLFQGREALPMFLPVSLAAAHEPVWPVTACALHVCDAPLSIVCVFDDTMSCLVSDPVHILPNASVNSERPRHDWESA